MSAGFRCVHSLPLLVRPLPLYRLCDAFLLSVHILSTRHVLPLPRDRCFSLRTGPIAHVKSGLAAPKLARLSSDSIRAAEERAGVGREREQEEMRRERTAGSRQAGRAFVMPLVTVFSQGGRGVEHHELQ